MICKDNGTDVIDGIVAGAVFSIGILFLSNIDADVIIKIIYAILYVGVISFVPTIIGFIILYGIILVFIVTFIYIKLKDRTAEIEKIYRQKNLNNGIKNKSSISKEMIEKNIIIDSEEEFEIDDEIYECERCFKRISEEEYESNDCMCEECFMDVHTDEHGEFHDEQYYDI